MKEEETTIRISTRTFLDLREHRGDIEKRRGKIFKTWDDFIKYLLELSKRVETIEWDKLSLQENIKEVIERLKEHLEVKIN